ncbi:hypothetical protein BDV10DRAFT_14755 [Aspergillus recurvatus]
MLDFFAMLSSVSGVVGQKDQANYVAANVLLDSLARYRYRCRLTLNACFKTSVRSKISHTYLGACPSTRASWKLSTAPLRTPSTNHVHQGLPLAHLQDIARLEKCCRATGYRSRLSSDARIGGPAANCSGGSSEADGAKELQALFPVLKSGPTHAAIMNAALEVVNKQFDDFG